MVAAAGITLLATGSATVVGTQAAGAAQTARTSQAPAKPKALLLGTSVTVPGPPPAGSGESIEQYEAQKDGYAVTSVTAAQWDAMTAAQFAKYRVLIIGDPTCDDASGFAPAVTDKATWEPVVMKSGGNKVLIGTDPTYHYTNDSAPQGAKLEANGIAYAGQVAGATGAYVDLSCAYASSAANTPVPLLDGLSTHGKGQFAVIGVTPLNACATGVNIVAQTGPTAGLTDADLSNWQCSVHEAFQKFPPDYTPLALAPTSSGFPSSYCADDVGTAKLVCGSPYIMVSGKGVVVKSQITLTPVTQTLAAGHSAKLVAHVVKGSKPLSGGSVMFDVNSGPDAGKMFTGKTNAAGNLAFTYLNTGAVGTDSISATYTAGAVSQKANATVIWTSGGAAPTKLTTSLSGGGKTGKAITVPVNTAVTDAAFLSGAKAATATGTVSYKVYSNAACTKLVAVAGSKTVTGGKVPHSAAVTLPAGKYYWTAAYGGNATNKASAGACGTEVLTVSPIGFDTKATAIGEQKVTVKVSTTTPGDLLVAFVQGDTQAKGTQTATVSSGGIKWKLAGRENTGRLDVEVWTARAAGVLHNAPVTVVGKLKCCDEAVTVLSFKNAVGTGAVATAHATTGAPTGTLKTRGLDSWVLASAGIWNKYMVPVPGAGQGLVSVLTDHDADQETFYTQARDKVTPKAGTKVAINDTAPVKYQYSLVLVEIR
jgi:hypothetical protein